jgi:hypothetical protein
LTVSERTGMREELQLPAKGEAILAEVTLWGPFMFFVAGGIPPKDFYNVTFTYSELFKGTITVTGHPHASHSGSPSSIIEVFDVSVQKKDFGEHAPSIQMTVHTTFRNRGTATIKFFEAYISGVS